MEESPKPLADEISEVCELTRDKLRELGCDVLIFARRRGANSEAAISRMIGCGDFYAIYGMIEYFRAYNHIKFLKYAADEFEESGGSPLENNDGEKEVNLNST